MDKIFYYILYISAFASTGMVIQVYYKEIFEFIFEIIALVLPNKLREKFTKLCQEEDINLTVPALKYCTDNAVMIGAAGYFAYQLGRRANLDLNAKATDKLQ